jgi:hypothetical protein
MDKMQTLEQQLATRITEPGEIKYHATFERYSDAGIENVKVFMVRYDTNSEEGIYLGDLEVNAHGYVGELIFNLTIVERTADSIHVPLNVLQEIAAYRLTPQETAKATA